VHRMHGVQRTFMYVRHGADDRFSAVKHSTQSTRRRDGGQGLAAAYICNWMRIGLAA
jgi:hypothetical protein